MSANQDFLKALDEEIENRIEIMEAPSYEGVPPFAKADVMVSVGLIVVCIVILIFAYNVLC